MTGDHLGTIEVEIKEPSRLTRFLANTALVAVCAAAVWSSIVSALGYRDVRALSSRSMAVIERVEANLAREIQIDDERDAEDGYACWEAQ